MGIQQHQHLLHIAMVSSPGTGHFTASLQLANRLLSLPNVEIIFFTTNTTTTIASHASSTTSTPPNLHFINLPPVDLAKVAPTNTSILSRISIILQHSLPTIRSTILASSPRPTVLIVDEFSTDAFPIAESLSMKMYILVTMNAAELSFMAYLPTLDRDIKVGYNQLTEPLQVPGCKPVPIQHLSDVLQDREGESYRCVLKHARRFEKSAGILVNTFQDLEPHTLTSLNNEKIARQIGIPPVYPVGPLINTSNRPTFDSDSDDSDYLSWLDKQPSDSVLYVSFGSGGTLSSEQLAELAHGLEASQQRFLWVVRPPQDKASAEGYFNGGNGVNDPSGYLPEGFLDRTRDVGFVVPSWVSQIEILNHRSVGGFFSHCGWNSTLESIVHGVPLVAFPLFAEQRLNAYMMADDAKVAVRSEKTPRQGVVGREEIEKMVRVVMEAEQGKRLRERARELKESALRGLEKGGSSYDCLSKLVEKWKTESAGI